MFCSVVVASSTPGYQYEHLLIIFCHEWHSWCAVPTSIYLRHVFCNMTCQMSWHQPIQKMGRWQWFIKRVCPLLSSRHNTSLWETLRILPDFYSIICMQHIQNRYKVHRTPFPCLLQAVSTHFALQTFLYEVLPSVDSQYRRPVM